jgi:hypothetical protein
MRYVLFALIAVGIATAALADPTPIIIDGQPWCLHDDGTLTPGLCDE